jgi:hypothetical protein
MNTRSPSTAPRQIPVTSLAVLPLVYQQPCLNKAPGYAYPPPPPLSNWVETSSHRTANFDYTAEITSLFQRRNSNDPQTLNRLSSLCA